MASSLRTCVYSSSFCHRFSHQFEPISCSDVEFLLVLANAAKDHPESQKICRFFTGQSILSPAGNNGSPSHGAGGGGGTEGAVPAAAVGEHRRPVVVRDAHRLGGGQRPLRRRPGAPSPRRQPPRQAHLPPPHPPPRVRLGRRRAPRGRHQEPRRRRPPPAPRLRRRPARPGRVRRVAAVHGGRGRGRPVRAGAARRAAAAGVRRGGVRPHRRPLRRGEERVRRRVPAPARCRTVSDVVPVVVGGPGRPGVQARGDEPCRARRRKGREPRGAPGAPARVLGRRGLPGRAGIYDPASRRCKGASGGDNAMILISVRSASLYLGID
jgi:hypothetical protein